MDDVPEGFKRWMRDNADRYEAARERGTLPYFIRDKKETVEGILKGSPSQLEDVIQSVGKAGIDYLEVVTLPKALTENEIIERLGGGDLTRGSCSSLAFAYAGNRSGLDVLDFRGAGSCRFFAWTDNIMKVANDVGGSIAKNASDYTNAKELLQKVQSGKEYYFTCGKHAAIVRKTETGFEYLELQDKADNGFKPLTDRVLKTRFKAQKSHTSYGMKYEVRDCLIDIDLLKKTVVFAGCLGISTRKKGNSKKGQAEQRNK